jgi:hypothetical protein
LPRLPRAQLGSGGIELVDFRIGGVLIYQAALSSNRSVILSGVAASFRKAAMQSKDPSQRKYTCLFLWQPIAASVL